MQLWSWYWRCLEIFGVGLSQISRMWHCHRPYGNLKQLLILEKPWNSILMDFIEQLPASSGFTTILVVIDRLTKQSIFIRLMTPSPPLSSPISLFSTYSPSTEFHLMSPPIEVQSLSPTSSIPWVKPWTWHFTSPLNITQKATDRWNAPIKPWNNTYVSIVIINRTIGLIFYP